MKMTWLMFRGETTERSPLVVSVCTQKRCRELTCSEASATTNPANAFSTLTLSGQLEAWPPAPPLHSHGHLLVCHSVYCLSTSCVPALHLPTDSATLRTTALRHHSSLRGSTVRLLFLTVICHDKPAILLDIYETHDQVLATTRTTRYSR